MISLYSEYTSIKDSKKKYVIYIYIYIYICRDSILLYAEKTYVNNTKEDSTICIDGEQIILESCLTRDYQGIFLKKTHQCVYLITKSSVLCQQPKKMGNMEIIQKILLRKLNVQIK